MTAHSLSSNVATLMLLAVQKDNLELNINYAVQWVRSAFERGSGSIETVIKLCEMAFPPIWFYLLESRRLSSREEKEDIELRRDRFKTGGVDLNLGDEGDERPAERLMKADKEFQIVFYKLSSFFANPPLSTTCDDTHHVLIAVTIILDYACLIYASQLNPTREDALERAYSRYTSSDFHNIVRTQFSAPPMQYSTLQFVEFILNHRL